MLTEQVKPLNKGNIPVTRKVLVSSTKDFERLSDTDKAIIQACHHDRLSHKKVAQLLQISIEECELRLKMIATKHIPDTVFSSETSSKIG